MPKTTISPSVITSRAASKEMERIKSAHSDLLTGMANQSMKIAANNQQKAAEMANQQAIQGEIKKAEIASNTEVQKTAMQNDLKRAELDIKRAALSAV